jgi:ethanolamine-phosphate phospho-lyase
MKDKLKQAFGITVTDIKKLNGYENFNYLISTTSDKYIFKTYTPDEELNDLIEGENEALLFLANDSKLTPTPIPFLDGDYVKILNIEGQDLTCRLLSFLDGQFLGDVNQSQELLFSFGTALAELDLKLLEFKNYTIKARKFEWDIQHLFLNEKYINDIPLAKDRTLVKYFFQQFKENVAPQNNDLRH